MEDMKVRRIGRAVGTVESKPPAHGKDWITTAGLINNYLSKQLKKV